MGKMRERIDYDLDRKEQEEKRAIDALEEIENDWEDIIAEKVQELANIKDLIINELYNEDLDQAEADRMILEALEAEGIISKDCLKRN